MYVHVKAKSKLEELEPLALIQGGEVELLHSECGGGRISIQPTEARVTLTCQGCQVEEALDRSETVRALRNCLLEDEYTWSGNACFVPF